VQKNKAIVGANAFAHESGIHQDGVLKERRTYEIIDPASVGRKSTLPLGRNSGRHALLSRAETLGIRVDRHSEAAFENAFKAFAANRRTIADSDLVRLAVEAGCA
jgi:2-isopropylmalate synthase